MSEVDLTLYCKPEEAEVLTGPFIRGEWLYATDGVIAIRRPVRDNDAIDVDAHIRAPNQEAIEKIFEGHTHVEFISFDIQFERAMEMCSSCDGNRVEAKDCPECKGAGYVWVTEDVSGESYPAECRTCIGGGQVGSDKPCRQCEGTGKESVIQDIPLFDGLFSGPRIWLLCNEQAPDTIQFGKCPNTEDTYRPLLWRNGEYQGALMPKGRREGHYCMRAK